MMRRYCDSCEFIIGEEESYARVLVRFENPLQDAPEEEPGVVAAMMGWATQTPSHEVTLCGKCGWRLAELLGRGAMERFKEALR